MRRARHRALLALVLAGLAWAAPARAQAPVVRTVEFDEAIRQAMDRNPTVAIAAAGIERASVLLDQARTLTRPTVTASFTNITLDSARGFSGGVTQPQNQSALSATASMPLFAPTAWAAAHQLRDQVEVATEQAAETRRQVAHAAAQAYLAVIAAQRQVDVDERALETARAHLDYAQKRLEGGAGSRLNQVRAAQAATGDEARLENSRLGLRRAQEALGVLLVEDGPVDAGTTPALETSASGTDAGAAANRPDVRAQAATVRAAERVVNDTWKRWLPNASVSFSPEFVTPKGLFQPSNTWRLVFTVTQSVLDPRPGIERALSRVVLREAEFSRHAVEVQAQSEIRLAREAVASYERVLERSRLAAEQANQVLTISTAAFEVGATTNLEVIDAQRSARDAETDAAAAEDAVRRARLELLVALGEFPK